MRMIDLGTEFGQLVQQRLKNAEVIWLTTVTPHGVAQPNPVWFYWDGSVIILYSQPGAYRIRNIQHNPTVTLNLDGADILGNNVVVIQGEASLNFNYPRAHAGYEKKYAKYLPELSLTFEQLVADYSVEIRIKPTRLRGNP
jgi:PPOX class probable F420-dependent enzyme